MSYGVGQVGTVSIVVARVNQWIEKPEENLMYLVFKYFCIVLVITSALSSAKGGSAGKEA